MLVSVALIANTRNSQRPVIQPKRAPAAGDNGSGDWPLYSVAAANPAPQSTIGHKIGAMNAAAHNPSNETAATAKLMMTARELRNEMRGGGAVGPGAVGREAGAVGSPERRAMSSSY